MYLLRHPNMWIRQYVSSWGPQVCCRFSTQINQIIMRTYILDVFKYFQL